MGRNTVYMCVYAYCLARRQFFSLGSDFLQMASGFPPEFTWILLYFFYPHITPPGPAANKTFHTMMLSPPCFTIGMVSLSAVFGFWPIWCFLCVFQVQLSSCQIIELSSTYLQIPPDIPWQNYMWVLVNPDYKPHTEKWKHCPCRKSGSNHALGLYPKAWLL